MSEVARFVLTELDKKTRIKYQRDEKALIERVKYRMAQGWAISQADIDNLLKIYNKKTEINRIKTGNRFYLD